MKAVVFTLGCKVNSCESSSLMTGLKNIGYEVSDKLEYADVYVINTCAVTQEAEKKSRQAVARVKKFNKDAKIIVTGCSAQKSSQDYVKKEGVTLVTGTKMKDKIINMLDQEGVFIYEDNDYYEEYFPAKTNNTRAYVKVEDGCNNFCSYCIIPYLRGRVRSRNPQRVIEEINLLSPYEVVITGINLSAYNYDGKGLTYLIESLKDVNCRIRLGSLEVNVINREFLQALKNLKNFAPHFHLSLQSGSNKVLKEMNRHYTREEYLEKCNLIREYFKDSAITTDIIVGYSTETNQDFLDSLDLAKKVEFSDIHCFPYSKREGTVGARLKELPKSVKDQRMEEILKVKQALKDNYILKNIGSQRQFLKEEMDGDYSVGYTENYIRTYVLGDIEEGLKNVEILEKFKDGVIAKLV